MKVVLVDDERLARKNMRAILTQFFPDLEIIAEADSVETGCELLRKITPDLVFLDVDLFDGSGFNILEKLNTINFKVIFVTAYSRFAIRAFRVNAIDYILKPVNVDELKQAVEKVRKEEKTISPEQVAGFNQQKNQLLAIKELDGIRYVKIQDIVRCKSDNSYCEIHLNDGELIVSSKTLKEYDTILEEFGFYRIHQSHLVNLKQIKKIVKRDGTYVQLETGDLLEVSRRRKEGLIKEMQSLHV